jgi:(E)-4-hydroxy-3-methylbut-2-enyl-diphosphate synthase
MAPAGLDHAALLSNGIGDTVRVSLSAPAREEALTAGEILGGLQVREDCMRINSCPPCGRPSLDIRVLLELVSFSIQRLRRPFVVTAGEAL